MGDIDETTAGSGAEQSTPQLGDLYERGRHLFSTRTAEGFEAREIKTNEQVLLWLLRFPFASGSEEASRFVRRLGDVEAVLSPPPRMRSYGVDARGSAYVAMDLLEGQSLFSAPINVHDVVPLFRRVIEAVVPLHRAGICLGDISEDSFLLLPEDRIALIGVVGSFDTGARKTGSLPQVETLQYISPEQRGGGSPDFCSDVYALGVFGYRLLTGRYLQAEQLTKKGVEIASGAAPAPSLVQPDLPGWVDDVIGAAVQPQPDRRYSDAGSLLQAVQSNGEINAAPNGKLHWSRRTVTVSSEDVATARAANKRRERAGTTLVGRRNRRLRGSKVSPLIVWVIAIAIGVFAAGAVFYWLAPDNPVVSDSQNTDVHLEYAPEELKLLLKEATDTSTTPDRRKEVLAEIAESSNPIAYAVLVSLTRGETPDEVKREVQQLLIQRIRNNRLDRAAEVLERWFETIVRTGEDPGAINAYGLFLRACDTSRFIKSRREALERAALSEPLLALQLAAALALDESSEKFTPILRGLLQSHSDLSGTENMGLPALLFAHKSLSIFVDKDLVNSIDQFSDRDLYNASLSLADRDLPLLREILIQGVKTRRFPPYRAVFLKPVLIEGDPPLSDILRRSLIKASFGKATEEDLLRFAKWRSPLSESVLLAVVATASDETLAYDAFDVVAGRNLRNEPARTLVAWVKQRLWKQRSRVMKPISVLAMPRIAGTKEFDFAFNALAPFAKYGLFKSILASDDSLLIEQAILQLGSAAKSEELVKLLGHKDEIVRIQAVRALKGRNDLAVLQSILQGYERETNEEVRQVYRELHWVTKER